MRIKSALDQRVQPSFKGERMTSGRMTIMGTRHLISAGHYLAAHAGSQRAH
jgi:hypothetical protein